MTQIQEKPTITNIAAAIESILFVSGRPLEYDELRKLLDSDADALDAGLETLARQLESHERGIRLQRLGTQVQLVTAPENARYIAALLGLPMTARTDHRSAGNAGRHRLSPAHHTRADRGCTGRQQRSRACQSHPAWSGRGNRTGANGWTPGALCYHSRIPATIWPDQSG